MMHTTPPSPCAHHGFSLIELLVAIFILGIGMIGIAALFPAGIAQQRQSTDEVMGPIVANNALAIIRQKVKAEDFGFFESRANNFTNPWNLPQGDWLWRRPGFYHGDAALDFPNGTVAFAGDISIFEPVDSQGKPGVDSEVPWNTNKYGDTPPRPEFVITQGERYYPQASYNSTAGARPKPQYVWDCMFRRYQGQILVAVFVYRVTEPGGGVPRYITQPQFYGDPEAPLPWRLDLSDPANTTFSATNEWGSYGPDDNPATLDDYNIVLGIEGGVAYDENVPQQAWQAPRQWILDQNNNVHRVLGNYRDDPGFDMEVELVRPVPEVAVIPANFFAPDGSPVRFIWYIPKVDSLGNLLTPVYVSVQEL
jgi:prepilin-type N-terminal cleavage/methylation domain-containing protein